ncbi:hypothetical protein Sste5346_008618 [Sporothrix stenoceras]|uniref:Carbonic anhydrase n=1 Tax=Sporothrix stenoceras TaxID=5173 RepID=A0ABR3YNT6_9PEZI
MPNIEDLLERNKAISHTPLPYYEELKQVNAPGPSTLIVTCIDPRCIPETFLNLSAGEVGVHRNAGGNIRAALRDINIVDTLFNLREICIIHHTDCGITHVTDEGVRDHIKANTDKEHWPEIDNLDVWSNADIEASVKGDLEWVRTTPLIREELKKGTQGFVFDIKTGLLTKVEPETAL